MREKAQKLVYLDTGNYISYNFLKNFYWYIVIMPLFMVVMGIYLLNQNGIDDKSLFPLISITIWTLIYWTMVLLIKSKNIKKSFELRFLVNGIVGFLISSLMWIFFATWNFMADRPFLKIDAFLWMIPFYLFVSVIYIVSIVISVHYGVYAKLKLNKKIIVLFSSSISLSAGLGLIFSRILRETVGLKIQHIVMSVVSIMLIFIPILAHINFVKYFYCKKYAFKCDENGDDTSPKLCPSNNECYKTKEHIRNKSKQKVFIMVIFVVCVLLAISIINFIKGFVQGFVQGI